MAEGVSDGKIQITLSSQYVKSCGSVVAHETSHGEIADLRDRQRKPFVELLN
jgi:hypothetical protein